MRPTTRTRAVSIYRIQTFAAVLVDGEPIAITGTLGHHLDVGGRAAASYGADATEIYQEGFRIPPTRIVSEGVPNEVFFPLFEANIRVPHKTISDLRAQIAALSIGAGEVLRLARRYGAAMIGAATRELIESSERRMRAAIAAVPPGIYEAEDIVDGDGLDDHELQVRVAVERRGDTLYVDFSGTAEQTLRPINPAPITPMVMFFMSYIPSMNSRGAGAASSRLATGDRACVGSHQRPLQSVPASPAPASASRR